MSVTVKLPDGTEQVFATATSYVRADGGVSVVKVDGETTTELGWFNNQHIISVAVDPAA